MLSVWTLTRPSEAQDLPFFDEINAKIYQIEDKEALNILKNNYENVDYSILNNLVADCPYDSIRFLDLQPGYYIILEVSDNQMYFEFRKITDFHVEIFLEDPKEPYLVVMDPSGNEVSDAKVIMDGKVIPFNHRLNIFPLNSVSKNSIIEVDYMGFRDFHKHNSTQYDEVQEYFKSIKKTAREYKKEKKFQILQNKPVYQPGDTLKVKVLAFAGSGSPYKKPIEFSIHQRNKDFNLGSIRPYYPGAYSVNFPLVDSLELTLDNGLGLYADGEYIDYFPYEKYELPANRFTLDIGQREHHRGELNRLILKGIDGNNLPVLGSQAVITILPKLVRDIYQEQLPIRDTLWNKILVLDPHESTVVLLPDSIFPDAKLEYLVKARFRSPENEFFDKEIRANFHHKKEGLDFRLINDSLYLDLYGENENQMVSLTRDYGKELRFVTDSVRVPYREKLDQYVYNYVASTKEERQKIHPGYEIRIECHCLRKKDSLIIKLENPNKLQFRYNIYREGQLVSQGSGRQLEYVKVVNDYDPYKLVLHYMIDGYMNTKSFQIPSNEDVLEISANGPSIVNPGQSFDFHLTVKDHQGKPVPGTDVTAFAYNNKFGNNDYPDPYITFPVKRLNYYRDQFRFWDTYTRKSYQGIPLEMDRWAATFGLLKIPYYQFLYPEKKPFHHSFQIEDSVTQFFPFLIQNGKIISPIIIYLDETPVYFEGVDVKSPSSIPADPGYHKVAVRTKNFYAEFDSVYFHPFQKTIFSADVESTYSRFNIQKASESLDEEEINRLSEVLIIDNKPSRFLIQKNKVQLTYHKNYQTDNPVYRLAGPFENGELFTIDGKGNHKSLFIDQQFRDSIKTRIVNRLENYDFRSPSVHSYLRGSSISDFILTMSDFGSDPIKIPEREVFPEPVEVPLTPTLLKGKMVIHQVYNPSDTRKLFRSGLLLKYGSTDFEILIPHHQKTIHDLPQGSYHLILYLEDSSYLRMDSIRILPNTTTYVKPEPDKHEIPDKLDSLIFKKLHESFRSYQNTGSGIYYYHGTRSAHRNHVYGSVYSYEDGEPLIGVNIVIKGKVVGTTSDFDGNFELTSVAPIEVLQFSIIGYETVEVPINGYSMITVHMKEQEILGSEVVIAASRVESDHGTPVTIEAIDVLGIQPAVSPDFYDAITYIDKEGSKRENNALLNKWSLEYVNSIIPSTYLNSIRSNFRDYAFWEPSLLTDAAGEANLKVVFPDNVTGWQFYAVGYHKDGKFGASRSFIRSLKSVYVALTTPNFLIRGDSVSIFAKVVNHRKDTIHTRNSFSVNGRLLSQKQSNIADQFLDILPLVADNDSVNMEYRTEVTDESYYDGENKTIKTEEVGVTENLGDFMILKSDSTYRMVYTEPVRIRAHATMLSMISDEIDHLKNYRFDCNEQLASKLTAFLMDQQFTEILGQSFKFKKDVKKIIDRLVLTQNSDGSWGWWNEDRGTPWLTLHVANTLKIAQIQGYRVPVDWARLETYLKGMMLNTTSPMIANQIDEYFSGELRNNPNFMGKLKEFSNINDWGILDFLSLSSMQQRNDLTVDFKKLISLKQEDIFGNYYWGDFYSVKETRTISTLLAYHILKNEYPEIAAKAKNYFINQRSNGHWRNTYEAALILQTLREDEEFKQDLDHSTLIINGIENKLPIELELEPDKPVSIRASGSSPVYLSSFREKNNSTPDKVDSLIDIQTYLIQDNDTLHELETGTRIKMVVSVNAKKDIPYAFIRIPIPAGCSYANRKLSYRESYREYDISSTNIFLEVLSQGQHHFEVELIPRFKGSFSLNPVTIENMYFPVFFGRNQLKRIRIRDN